MCHYFFLIDAIFLRRSPLIWAATGVCCRMHCRWLTRQPRNALGARKSKRLRLCWGKRRPEGPVAEPVLEIWSGGTPCCNSYRTNAAGQSPVNEGAYVLKDPQNRNLILNNQSYSDLSALESTHVFIWWWTPKCSLWPEVNGSWVMFSGFYFNRTRFVYSILSYFRHRKSDSSYKAPEGRQTQQCWPVAFLEKDQSKFT